MTVREFHWKVTGWRATLIGGVILAVPFALVFAAGLIVGRA